MAAWWEDDAPTQTPLGAPKQDCCASFIFLGKTIPTCHDAFKQFIATTFAVSRGRLARRLRKDNLGLRS